MVGTNSASTWYYLPTQHCSSESSTSAFSRDATYATSLVTLDGLSARIQYIRRALDCLYFFTTLAFWLRSSVVSVLKSIIAFILPPVGQVYYLIFDSPCLRPLLARRSTR
jgi:hypothetical protein